MDRRIPSNKAFKKQRWTPCGEADRPTSVEGGRILQRTSPRSRIGPIKEIHVFNKEGSSGTDVKVPSISNPEILIWVNVCTEEVHNCRQIAAIKTLILTENQSTETSGGSGKLVAQNVKVDSEGKP